MSNQITFSTLKDSYSSLKRDQDLSLFYNEIASYTLEEKVLIPFVKVVFKANQRHNRLHLFWKSSLPVNHAKTLLNSDMGIELLCSYFESSQNVNPEFVKKASQIDPKLFIKTCKLYQLFGVDEHFESLSFLEKNSHQELRGLYREFKCLRAFQFNWFESEAAQFYKTILLDYSYENLFIHIISYFEAFKRSHTKLIANRNLLVEREMNLCFVINKMLTEKKLSDKEVLTTKQYTLSEFRKKLTHELPLEKVSDSTHLPFEHESEEKELVREMIEFYYSRHAFEVHVQKYSAGYANFSMIDDDEAELITNRRFTNYWKNDRKYKFLDRMMMNKGLSALGISENSDFGEVTKTMVKDRVKWQIQNNLIFLELLHYPSVLRNGLKIADILRFLAEFSVFMKPKERGESRFIPKEFTVLFDIAYAQVWDQQYFHESVQKWFNWDENKAKKVIQFLTTDFNSEKNFSIDIMTRPLLKVGDYYYWLSDFYADRSWGIIMSSRLDIKIPQSDSLETAVAELLKEKGFKAIAGHRYKFGGSRSGDIDIAAYKDGHLFLFEQKITSNIYTDAFLEGAKYGHKTFDAKAVEQHRKAIDYLEAAYSELKEKLQLTESWEEIKPNTHSLIISNTFALDHEFANEQFLKISLFELFTILNNNLYDHLKGNMPFSFGMLENMMNAASPFVNNEETTEITKENCNLWKNDKIHATDLIEAIRYERVFKAIREIYPDQFRETIVLKTWDREESEKWFA